MAGNKYFTGVTGINRLFENIGNLGAMVAMLNGNIVVDCGLQSNSVIYCDMSGVTQNYRLFLSNIPYGSSGAIPNNSFSSLTFTTIVNIPTTQTTYYWANSANIRIVGGSDSTVTPVSSGGLSNIAAPTTAPKYLVQQFNIVFPGSSTPIIFTNVLWMY
jgi:hypothetical protein